MTDSNFDPIQNRDAWASIRGFVYQVDITILRWICLNEDQILELEAGEDIDIIGANINGQSERQLEQIKFRESNLTLNSEIVIELLVNFCNHRINNPDTKILFRYVTNANYSTERPALFLDGKGGIETWIELRSLAAIPPDDERFITIYNHFQSLLTETIGSNEKKEEKSQFRIALDFISKKSNFIDLIRDFEWSLNNKAEKTLLDEIQKILAEKRLVPEGADINNVYKNLFVFIFKLLSQKGLKSLNRNQLTSCIQSTLSEGDLAIFSFITETFQTLNRRVLKLEEKLALESVDIQSLQSGLSNANTQIGKFDLLRVNFSSQLPLEIQNGSRREKKVQEINILKNQTTWIFFHGINGTGKSQLAALICLSSSSYWWLDLRGFKDDYQKSTSQILLFMEWVSKVPLETHLPSWLNKVKEKIPAGSVIIFNDLPTLSNDSLGDLLVHLTNAFQESGINLLTTSNSRLPVAIKEKINPKRIVEYDDFSFDTEEVRECLINNGADDKVLNYSSLICSICHKNPRLINSAIQHLKSINWGKDSSDLFEVLIKKEFQHDIIEDTQRSIKKFITNEYSRELLYRLSLITWDFRIEDIDAVCEIEIKINLPGDKLIDLTNSWIQQQTTNFYYVSPIIHDLGKKVLSKDQVQNIYFALGKSIISGPLLDTVTASRAINCFIQADQTDMAGQILINVYRSAKNANEIKTLKEWGFTNYWMTTPFPSNMNVALRCFIINEQIRTQTLLKNNTKKLVDKLIQLSNDPGNTASTKAIVLLMCLNHIKSSPQIFLYKLQELATINFTDSPEVRNLLSTNTLMPILWSEAQFITLETDIIKWLKLIFKFEKLLALNLTTDSIAKSGIVMICSKISDRANKDDDEPKKIKVLKTLEKLSSLVSIEKDETLNAIINRSIILFHVEKLGNENAAISRSEKILSKLKNPEAKYTIFKTLGTYYFYSKEKVKSASWIRNAIETNSITASDFPELLIFNASVISSSEPGEAVANCLRAVKISSKSKYYSELDFLGVQCELGISYWLNDNLLASFEVFEVVVEKLFDLKNIETYDWKRFYQLIGHSLGYIAALILDKRTPLLNGEPFFKPYQGMFMTKNNEIAKLYNEADDPAILVQMAFFAEGLGNMPKAYFWSVKAFDLSRKIKSDRMLTMVSTTCSHHFILNDKFEEALESTLLATAISSHFQESSDKRYETLKKIDLTTFLSKKPDPKWDTAEDTTITFAVTPMFIRILLLSIENASDKKIKIKRFLKMVHGYQSKASDKESWKSLANITENILNNKISIAELIEQIKVFGQSNKRNFQMLACLGIISLSKDPKIIVEQLINVCPIILQTNRKSINKYLIIPFVKNRMIFAWREFFIGEKEDLEKEIKVIQYIDPSLPNACQQIINPILSELGIKLSTERKAWLDNVSQNENV
ncbi:MAG: hypothetical protein HOP08_01080 [Cyclobacteriaceae bacterium]|nr:hypothetical protein [Cyclobacteriaceae bacterium]